jgi:hypothetical protein
VSSLMMRQRGAAVLVAMLGVSIAACAGSDRPTGTRASADEMTMSSMMTDNPNSAAGDAKGFINGWLNGETAALRYTRMYFCAEPPTSAVSTHCEVGADATIAPRSGPIPILYALGPAGIHPDPSTIHCPGGTVCLNHPHALDLSRLGLPDSVQAPPHSHILTDRQAGWHRTVNIRITSLAAWNEIAAAKSLTKVRELQAAGIVGPDVPTNIYFFLEVQDKKP